MRRPYRALLICGLLTLACDTAERRFGVAVAADAGDAGRFMVNTFPAAVDTASTGAVEVGSSAAVDAGSARVDEGNSSTTGQDTATAPPSTSEDLGGSTGGEPGTEASKAEGAGCNDDKQADETCQCSSAGGSESCSTAVSPCESSSCSDGATCGQDGEICDDGMYCTVNDRCRAGKCVGDERACDDGVACNGAESCDETQDECVAAKSTCADGQTCDVENDECISTCTGCIIGGNCYSDGAVSPTNPCMVCDASTSNSDWSVALAAVCDDGEACTSDDRCNGAGVCVGTPAVGGDCDCIDNSDCDDGVGCTTDTCNDGTCSNALQAGWCRINGTCVADGTAEPSNRCRYCDASSNQAAWTNSSLGTDCDDGLWCNGEDTCNAGACVHEFPNGNRCAGSTGACETTSCSESKKSCFQDDTHICRTETTLGCLASGCSSDVMTWEIDHYCRGDRADCSGGKQVSRESQATIYDNCQSEELCNPNTNECSQALECSGDTYCDESSGLCWMSKNSVSTYTQAEAKAYCEGLTFAGSSDWHLPTNDDARSVTRGCNSDFCQAAEGPGISGCYWPTEMGSCSANLWLDNTMSGYWVPTNAAIGFTAFGDYHVRCVTAWPGH